MNALSLHNNLFPDWNELFTTKCVSCGFPIEAGDRWVEALNNNYHSQCFNCTVSTTAAWGWERYSYSASSFVKLLAGILRLPIIGQVGK